MRPGRESGTEASASFVELLRAVQTTEPRSSRLPFDADNVVHSPSPGLCHLSSLLGEQFSAAEPTRSSSFQGCPTHVLKAPGSGKNMLAHTRSRAQEVPQFVVTPGNIVLLMGRS